jgi:hypothetical protein
MIIHLQCCNVNSIKSITNKSFQVLQLFTTVWITHTNIMSIVCRDLVLVERMQCTVLSGEAT